MQTLSCVLILSIEEVLAPSDSQPQHITGNAEGRCQTKILKNIFFKKEDIILKSNTAEKMWERQHRSVRGACLPRLTVNSSNTSMQVSPQPVVWKPTSLAEPHVWPCSQIHKAVRQTDTTNMTISWCSRYLGRRERRWRERETGKRKPTGTLRRRSYTDRKTDDDVIVREKE